MKNQFCEEDLAVRTRIGLSVMALETRRDAIIGLATAGDSVGYDGFFMPETWAYDMTVLLAEAAVRTTRIKLGTGIVGIWNRSAATIAMAAATLDAISGGRFVLGLGASTPQLAEGLHDVAFEPPVRRMRRMVTQIRILLRGERIPLAVTKSARALKLNLPPTPSVSVNIAALGDSMTRLAGEPTRGRLSSIPGRSCRLASNVSGRGRRGVAIRIASRRFIPVCQQLWPTAMRKRARVRRGLCPCI
jgi:alkanesulfonate monooxygenase SsuD/methylene tetrahydromethanopterin reductase-like flavin-dependent oxidoreductase (luciferase family)